MPDSSVPLEHFINITLAGYIPAIAQSLEELALEVVFIGASIAPLLQTHPPFEVARATKDVDGVVATANYRAFERIQERLLGLGFVPGVDELAHAHRWISPTGIPFDLIPAGTHLGSTGNPWDRIAVETAISVTFETGLSIRIANPVAFLALKWSAFHDRGKTAPYFSHDIEDIVAVIASRPHIVDEVTKADPRLKTFVVTSTADFLKQDIADDIVSGALGNVINPSAVKETRERLREISHTPLPLSEVNMHKAL